MNNDSKRTSVNEMEQIQRGLEEFLENEIRQARAERQGAAKEGSSTGLPRDREPQLFTIGEEGTKEKEIDVIGFNSHGILGEDYVEDWDSGTKKRSTRRDVVGRESTRNQEVRKGRTGRQGARRKSARQGSAKAAMQTAGEWEAGLKGQKKQSIEENPIASEIEK